MNKKKALKLTFALSALVGGMTSSCYIFCPEKVK